MGHLPMQHHQFQISHLKFEIKPFKFNFKFDTSDLTLHEKYLMIDVGVHPLCRSKGGEVNFKLPESKIRGKTWRA